MPRRERQLQTWRWLAAIDDPLEYRDFLILDEDTGEIAFDEEYVREGEEEDE